MGKEKRKRRDSSDSSEEDIRKRIRRLESMLKEVNERSGRPRRSRPRGISRRSSRSSSGSFSSDLENDPLVGALRSGRDPERSTERDSEVEYTCNNSLVTEDRNVEFCDVNQANDSESTARKEDDPLEVTEPLDPQVLSILGDEGNLPNTVGEIIHTSIATQWQNILVLGLSEENRNKLVRKHPPAKNCPFIEAPKLNLEIKAAVNEAAIRRDDRLSSIQNQIGASLAAIGRALTLLLSRDTNEEGIRLVELLSDAARMLADVHHSESESRKILLGYCLNKTFKEALVKAPLDGWLFGAELSDRLKSVKALERSSSDLRVPVKPRQKVSSNLNFRGPPRHYKKKQSLQPRQGGHSNSRKRVYRDEKLSRSSTHKRENRRY